MSLAKAPMSGDAQRGSESWAEVARPKSPALIDACTDATWAIPFLGNDDQEITEVTTRKELAASASSCFRRAAEQQHDGARVL